MNDLYKRRQQNNLSAAERDCYANQAFESGEELFHKNIRLILEMCWPDIPFDQKMRRVWITESVLCSASKSGGSVKTSVSRACGRRYLVPQLDLFPTALVVALGAKARKRLRAVGVHDFLNDVWAVAPPGANNPEARASWDQIPIHLRQRLDRL